MMFVFTLETLAIIGFAVVLVTQVAWPLWRDTPLFPFFRRERWLRRRLVHLKQEEVELDLQRRIELEEQIRKEQQQSPPRKDV